MNTPSLSYSDYVQGIQRLAPEEQFRLVEVILAHLQFVMRTQPESPLSKLANLKPHWLIVGDPDELVDIKVWEWKKKSA